MAVGVYFLASAMINALCIAIVISALWLLRKQERQARTADPLTQKYLLHKRYKALRFGMVVVLFSILIKTANITLLTGQQHIGVLVSDAALLGIVWSLTMIYRTQKSVSG